MASIAERTLKLSGARRRILKALMDPDHAGLGPEALCRVARVARSTYWETRRDPEFLELVDDTRDTLFPLARVMLAKQVIEDALQPLQEANGPGEAGALVKTREQAAGLLGMDLTPPGKVQHDHQGQGSMVHQMAERYPREALETFEATGSWDEERWGLPPWRALRG